METAKGKRVVPSCPSGTYECPMCKLYMEKIVAMSEFINWVSGKLSDIAVDMNGNNQSLNGIILKLKGGAKGIVH